MRYAKRTLTAAVLAGWFIIGTLGTAAAGEAVPDALEPILAIPEQIRVPVMEQSPTVDGTIGEGEYASAIGLSGVHTHLSSLSPRQAVFKVGWDGKELFLAMRIEMREGELPRFRDRRRDHANVTDSSLEMRITVPRVRQADAGQEIGPYFFVANVRGAVTDALEANEIGQTFYDWNADVRSASTFRQGVWELEMAVSPDSMLAPGYVPGDVWGLMLARNWHDPWDQAALRTTFKAPLDMRLGDSPLAVGMGVVDGLYEGTNKQTLTVRNVSDKPVEAKVYYVITRQIPQGRRKPPKVEYLNHEVTPLTLAPGKAKTFETIPHEPTWAMKVTPSEEALAKQENRNPKPEKVYDPYVVEVAVTSPDEETVYYRRHIEVTPMVRAGERVFRGTPKKFAYDIRYYKWRERLRVNVDTFTLPERKQAHRARAVVSNGKDKEVASFELPPFDDYFATAFQDMKLPPDTYEAAVVILDKGGKPLAEDTYAFEIKDYPWETCTRGTSDRILPWFEPCRYRNGALLCWNREYRMAPTGLPAQIVANTDPDRKPRVWGGWEKLEHLASPVRIEVDTAAGTLRSDAVAGDGFVATEVKDAVILGEGGFGLGGLRFDVKTRFEPDGMLKLTVTYRPDGSAPVAVEGVRFVVPYNWSAAKRVTHPIFNGKPHTSRLLEEKAGPQWVSTDPLAKVPMPAGSFMPMVWFGTPENGVVYWADSDRGWVPSDAKPAVALVGSEDKRRRELVLNIVSESFSVKEARTFELALEATPARPRPPATKGKTPEHPNRAWNMVDMVKSGRAETRNAPRAVDCFDYEKWTSFAASYYLHGGIRNYGIDYQRGKQNDKCAIHIETGSKREIPAGFPDWRTRRFPESYIRFTAYHMSKWLTIPFGIDAYYYDCVSVSRPCFDTDAGYGYALPDGRVQPEFELFALRDFFKRTAMVPLELGKPSCNTFHTSGPHQYVHCFPFVEERIEGEHNRVPIPEKGPAPVIRRLGEKMLLNRSLAWGVPVLQLNNSWHGRVPDEEDRRKTKMAEFAMWRIASAGGSIPGCATSWGSDPQLGVFHYAHRRALDTEKTWYLIPPWRAKKWFGCDHPALRIIAWKSERRMLFYLANWSDKKLHAFLTPDWHGLGFNPDGKYEIQNLTNFSTDRSRNPAAKSSLRYHRGRQPSPPTWRLQLEPNTIEGYLFIQYAWPYAREENGEPYAVRMPEEDS